MVATACARMIRRRSPTCRQARLRPGPVTRGFKAGQLASGGLLAISHGTNDAQKTMGIITLALIAHGDLSADNFEVPTWVVVSAALELVGVAAQLARLAGHVETARGLGAAASEHCGTGRFRHRHRSQSIHHARKDLRFPGQR